MTITEAFVKYDTALKTKGFKTKTRINYRSTLHSFVKLIGDVPVQLVTYDTCARWKELRELDGNAASTISGDMARLRQVFKHLRKLGVNVIDSESIESPKIPQKTYTWLTVEEVEQLLSVVNRPRDKALIACLFSSGARISELLGLDRNSIYNGEAQIVGKGDKMGTLNFDDSALYYLDEYLKTRIDRQRPLFLSGQHRRLTQSRISQLIHEYTDAAGIDKNVTSHVLRHSFASDLKLNGADIYDIKEQLRHSSITTTQIYTHMNNQQNKEKYRTFHSKISIAP